MSSDRLKVARVGLTAVSTLHWPDRAGRPGPAGPATGLPDRLPAKMQAPGLLQLLLWVSCSVSSGSYRPTLAPLTLQPGTPFAFGCAGPEDPALLEPFTSWFLSVLQPTALATLAFDSGNGPGGWNGDASASVYIKHKTPVLYYQFNEPLNGEQVAVLRRLDAAGVYNSFQIGEWGASFFCLTRSEDPAADARCGHFEHGTDGSCGASSYFESQMSCGGHEPAQGWSQPNCSSMNCSAIHPSGAAACGQRPLALRRNPANNSEANAYLRQAYQDRDRLVQYGGPGGGSHSTPGLSLYVHKQPFLAQSSVDGLDQSSAECFFERLL